MSKRYKVFCICSAAVLVFLGTVPASAEAAAKSTDTAETTGSTVSGWNGGLPRKDFYFRIDFGKLFENISPELRDKILPSPPGGDKSRPPYQTKLIGCGWLFPCPNQMIRLEGKVIEPVPQYSIKTNFFLVRQGLVSAGGDIKVRKVADTTIHDVRFPSGNARLQISMPDSVNTDVLFTLGGTAEDWSPSNRELLSGAPDAFSADLPLAVLSLKPERLRSSMPVNQTFQHFFGKTELMTLVLTVHQDKLRFKFDADHFPESEFAFLKNWVRGLLSTFPWIRDLTPTLMGGNLVLSGEIDLQTIAANTIVPSMPPMLPAPPMK